MRRIVISFALSILAGMAGAHSTTDFTDPADGAVLEAAPEAVKLRFDNSIRLTRVELTHSDGDSEPLDLTAFDSFATEFVLPLTVMGAGRYEIEWRGLGEDGHAMKGRFGFEVK